jgi:diguanylate cyclase (GGDEF)-like protein
MKILVADDDVLSRRMMQKMLERSGYEVVTAEDGRQAADILAGDDGPRLALIDWMMPELDGPGVCRQVRQRHNTRYVYMTLLTAKQASEDIVVGLEAGADDYLIKPCNPEELKARLRTGVRILDLEDKLVEAREEMRYRATHDALTSLRNRATVMADFERELARARREQGVVSIILCDIDHFKRVNDTYGHPVGDEVLKQVASRLLSSVRSYDSVGRYGGEEFLLILSGCNSSLAQRRAEDIRNSNAEHPFETSAGPLSVNVSIGVLASSDWGKGLSTAHLLNEVDQALYRAKASGRNCVKLALPAIDESYSKEVAQVIQAPAKGLCPLLVVGSWPRT